jgi:hypothetical protein
MSGLEEHLAEYIKITEGRRDDAMRKLKQLRDDMVVVRNSATVNAIRREVIKIENEMQEHVREIQYVKEFLRRGNDEASS